MSSIQNSKYYFRVGIHAFCFFKIFRFRIKILSTKFADSSQSKETRYSESGFDFVSFLEGMHHILQFDIHRCFLIKQGSD
jgi:hypothetical protein